MDSKSRFLPSALLRASAFLIFTTAPVARGGDIRVYEPVAGVGDGTESYKIVASQNDYADLSPATTATGTKYLLSGVFSGGDKLFDNNQTNRWVVQANSGWAVYDFGAGNATMVNAYGLLQSNNNGYGSRSPKTFRLFGSNSETYSLAGGTTNGADWVLLDARSSSSYFGTAGTTVTDIRIFKTNNTGTYRFYMLAIPVNNGDSYTVLGELEFYQLNVAGSLTVEGDPAPYGSPTPAYGDAGNVGGQQMTFTAPVVGTNVAETTIWSCTGYTVYTNDADGVWLAESVGSIKPGASVQYTCSDASQTKWVWNFDVQHKVAAAVSGSGSVSGAGWYGAGDTATLEATPGSADIAFSHWFGDGVAAAIEGDNPLSFQVAAPVNVTANFGTLMHVATTGDDGNDGSEALPKASIQAAVDALGSGGGVVRVAAGTYANVWTYDASRPDSNSVVVVTTPVRIVGATTNAPDVVVTRDSGQNKRIFYLGHPDAFISHLTVSNGYNKLSTSKHGGNVYIGTAGGTVSDCIVTKGWAQMDYASHGGNIYMNTGAVVRCVIEKGTSADNAYGGRGSACYMAGGVLENCLVRNQTYGRFAINAEGASRVVNCTIIGNKTSGNTSFAGVYASSAAKIANCVIIGNLAGDGSSMTNNVWNGTAANFVNCLADAPINPTCLYQNGTAGFADPAAGDYRLTSTSIALDAGAAYATTGATSPRDLDGNPRVAGDGVDIGCYELQMDDMQIAFDADVVTGINPLTATFTASVIGAPAGELEYAWDFDGDGDVDLTTGEASCSHTYDDPSTNSVKLTVTVGAASASLTRADYINVSPNTMFVRAASTTAAYPYMTWETAASNLATAVGIAATGSRIIVSNGTYTAAASFNVPFGAVVEGLTGNPDDVVINMDGRYNYVMNDPDAVLSSVKIVSGSAALGGGVRIGHLGGTLTNCIVANCYVAEYDCQGGGVLAQGAKSLVTHCVVTNCTVWGEGDYEGEKACGIQMNGGRVENSLVVGCQTSTATTQYKRSTGGILVGSGAVAANCTVVDCAGHIAGGIRGFGAVTNCVAAGCDNKSETAAVPSDAWSGAAENFVNCATDTAEAINPTCVTGSLATFFKDAAAGDYRPLAGGVLSDRGAAVVLASSTDLGGNPRVFGSRIDIGAYEGQVASATLMIVR